MCGSQKLAGCGEGEEGEEVNPYQCSFCGHWQDEARYVIVGPVVRGIQLTICEECVRDAVRILEERREAK